jgi:hypothetical protein
VYTNCFLSFVSATSRKSASKKASKTDPKPVTEQQQTADTESDEPSIGDTTDTAKATNKRKKSRVDESVRKKKRLVKG